MNKKFEYIETEKFNGFATIEVNSITGIVNLAEANTVKFVFTTKSNGETNYPDEFFFPIHQTIYIIKSNGFYTLEDYYISVAKKFPSSLEFYEALKNNYDSYEEYKHSKKAGNNGNKESFENAKMKGFVKNFDAFMKRYENYKNHPRTAIILSNIDSPIMICEFAESKGFKNYNEFEKAYDAGYPDFAIYTEASAKGYKSSDDFFDAVGKGFTTPADYETAKAQRIVSKKELDDYRYLKSGNIKNLAFDEYHVIMVLRTFDNGKKVMLTELREILTKEQEPYQRSFGEQNVKVLPLWYKQKIVSENEMHNFLVNHPEVKKLGSYDATKKVFEIFRLSKTKVYIDASNVAYNSSTDKSKNAQFKNIRLVCEELAVWKFTDIVVIADASLKHKAKDTFELERIKKLAEYLEAPSHTQADGFLLEMIHHEKCIIVSNDTFSDWKKKDLWIRQNIDSIRIPFMIKDNKVVLERIEKIAKENS